MLVSLFVWEGWVAGVIRAAVTRKDRKGKVWAPQEKVDRPTALRMIKQWAADYVLKGDRLGSIEKGKLADLVVLDRDYMTIPEDDIGKVQSLITVWDGKPVFLDTAFSAEYNLKPANATISTYKDLVKRRVQRAGVSTGG